MAQATIRDVAREADVSVASVSRALNGHSSVRPEMRDRVQRVATRLGYFPHAGARNLSLSSTNSVGVMLPDLHGEFFSEALRGLDREASARGLQLLLSSFHDDPQRAIEGLRTMRGRVDGLVLMGPGIDSAVLAEHLPRGIPAVLINCVGDHADRAEFRVDNAGAARAMVDHLVAAGRRGIVHVAGIAGNAEAAERTRGYREAMAAHGLAPRVLDGDFHHSGGVAAARWLLAERGETDALFCANDEMAIGALVTLRDAGVAVPDEVAVTGFDDVPLARLVSPPLTTMNTDIAKLCERAVARLADIIGGSDDRTVQECAPTLVVRGTG